MSGLQNLQNWQRDNVERACNAAVREADFYGLDAADLKRLIAAAWQEHFEDKALDGSRELQA